MNNHFIYCVKTFSKVINGHFTIIRFILNIYLNLINLNNYRNSECSINIVMIRFNRDSVFENYFSNIILQYSTFNIFMNKNSILIVIDTEGYYFLSLYGIYFHL